MRPSPLGHLKVLSYNAHHTMHILCWAVSLIWQRTADLSGFLHVIYATYNASVILERNGARLERNGNEARLERNEQRLERNEKRLEGNETRGGKLLLSGTV